MLRQERKRNHIKCSIKYKRQEKTVKNVVAINPTVSLITFKHQWSKFTN